MYDKEILAELKCSYEYLQDIRENGCSDHCGGQMKENISKLDNVLSNIEDIYYDFYKTLNREDLRVKKREDCDNSRVYISRCVTGDYEIDESPYNLSCMELGYYWYKDTKFIREGEEDYEV